MTKDEGIVLQGVDILDTIEYLSSKNKKFQATLLNSLEEILGKESEEFLIVRKLYLDSTNNFLRATVNIIFGDVERTNASRH